MSIGILVTGISDFDSSSQAPPVPTWQQSGDNSYLGAYVSPFPAIGIINLKTLLQNFASALADDYFICEVGVVLDPAATSTQLWRTVPNLAPPPAAAFVNNSNIFQLGPAPVGPDGNVVARMSVFSGENIAIVDDAPANPAGAVRAFAMNLIPLSTQQQWVEACCCGDGPQFANPGPPV